MKSIISLSQKAYSISIIGLGIQQLAYGDFDPNILPQAFSTSPVYHLLAYPWGIIFTLSGIALLFNKKAFEIALISGGAFLALFLFAHLPYLLFFSPDRIFMWSPAMGGLALAGSSLIMAASYQGSVTSSQSTFFIHWLKKLIPFAGIFFSLRLIVFGIDHFVYVKYVSGLVPSWIPGSYFWTYFTGVALIGAGVAIILKVQVKTVGILLGLMILFWCIFLHFPRAIGNPVGQRGLELTRVFVTLGASGIAFLLAFKKIK